MDFPSSSLLFFFLAFISEIIGTISGFGSSIFFVPLAGLLFDFKTTLALTALLHIFSTSAQLFAFRNEIQWRLIWTIGIPSLLFVATGASLSSAGHFRYAELTMGVFLFVFAVLSLTNRNFKLQPSTLNGILGGSLSGFLTGLIGTGGAIRGATLSAFNLTKGAFISTSAGIDLAGDTTRAIVYLKNGYLEKDYYWYIPVMILVAYAGVFTGRKIVNRLSNQTFRTVVLFFILSIGLFMIYKVTINPV